MPGFPMSPQTHSSSNSLNFDIIISTFLSGGTPHAEETPFISSEVDAVSLDDVHSSAVGLVR